MYKYFVLLFIWLSPMVIWSQETGPIATIQNIIIEGNKKTKEQIILRELDVKKGDTIYLKDFQERFFKTKKRLLSTSLFNMVKINFQNYNDVTKTTDIHILVRENLFIYPAPIIEFADRNFNVWWEEQNHSFSRLNYGLRLDHINLTGVKDKLKLKLQFGYTRKYEIDYNYPYLDDAQTIGLGFNIFFAEQKEIGYITRNNKTEFFQAADERNLLNRFRVGTTLNYRPNLFTFNTVRLEFHRNGIDDLVATQLNPDYFLNGKGSIKFFFLEYNYEYNKRIFDIYPEGGYAINFNIKKEGLGIFKDFNNLSVHLDLEKHFRINRFLFTTFRLKGKANLIRNDVAFANNTGLGYGDNIVGGYELYVLDGTDFVLGESQLKARFFHKVINLSRYMPISAFKQLDLKIFLRWNTDMAYVNEPKYATSNDLNNRWVIGYGPSLDFLFYNNFLFKFEYNFNQLGESGLFIHNSLSF